MTKDTKICSKPEVDKEIRISTSESILKKEIRPDVVSVLCSRAHRGLLVGILLLQYSVVCIVDSLSLFYLLFIS